MEASYVVHCLDETITGEGFVQMIQKHFWAQYTYSKFFWFNTMLHVLNILGIVLYEILGGTWVVWPLALSWMFVTNGLWHVLGAIMFKKYHPGLMTSILYWIIIYFIIRYSYLPGQISQSDFIVSLVIGTLLTIVMIGSLFLMPVLFRKKL
jgi:hypothetical protein